MDKQIAIIFKSISLLKLPLMCCCTCIPQMYVLRRKKKTSPLPSTHVCIHCNGSNTNICTTVCARTFSLSLCTLTYVYSCTMEVYLARKKKNDSLIHWHSFIFHWHMSAHLYLECMRTKSRSIYETKQWNKWMRENPKRTRRKLLLSACMWDKRESNSKLKS